MCACAGREVFTPEVLGRSDVLYVRAEMFHTASSTAKGRSGAHFNQSAGSRHYLILLVTHGVVRGADEQAYMSTMT